MSRFAASIPILDWSFNGPAPTDTHSTPWRSTSSTTASPISRCIRSMSSPPLNAVLGIVVRARGTLSMSAWPAIRRTRCCYQGTHGDTDYYLFENPDLPLFGPLRTLGVPEPVIDVFEPFFREVVELGYDRSIPAWEPTPARLIPQARPSDGGRWLHRRDRGRDRQRRCARRTAGAIETSCGIDGYRRPWGCPRGRVADERIHRCTGVGCRRSHDSEVSGRTNGSTPLSIAGHARQTPSRDAVRNSSSGVRERRRESIRRIEKATSVGNGDDIKARAKRRRRESPVSTSSADRD